MNESDLFSVDIEGLHVIFNNVLLKERPHESSENGSLCLTGNRVSTKLLYVDRSSLRSPSDSDFIAKVI